MSKCLQILLSEYAGYLITLAEYAGYRITLAEVNYAVFDGYLTDENGLVVTDENGNGIEVL